MTEDAVKGIQTALWAALVLVQMGVVGCLEVRAETVHREVTYEAVEDEAALPEEIMVSVLAGHDGKWFHVRRWAGLKKRRTGRMIFLFR